MPAKNANLPDGWESKPLGDLLTFDQIKVVTGLIDKHRDDGPKLLYELKKYFKSIESDLAIKKVDAAFLAYAVFSKIMVMNMMGNV